MRSVTLTRKLVSADYTLGEWLSDSGFKCFTIERPWLNNAPDISCIPPGTYLCKWSWSPKHNCNNYHLQNVPGRSNCEIHSANVAEQLEGCIAPGNLMGTFKADSIHKGMPSKDTEGVCGSIPTLAQLEKDLREEEKQLDFNLTIIGG